MARLAANTVAASMRESRLLKCSAIWAPRSAGRSDRVGATGTCLVTASNKSFRAEPGQIGANPPRPGMLASRRADRASATTLVNALRARLPARPDDQGRRYRIPDRGASHADHAQ